MNTKHVVGRFRLGYRWIEVRIEPANDNGSVVWAPYDPQITVMVIGIRKSSWALAMGTLLHESFEAAMADLTLRFSACENLGSSSGDCIFVMTHAQFNEVADRVGHFMSSVLPVFRRAYLKCKRKGKN